MTEPSHMTPSAAPPTAVVVQRSSGGMVGMAGDVVEAFRSSPTLLLIVLLNGAFAGAGGYVITRLEEQRHIERMAMMDRCLPDINLRTQLQHQRETGSKDLPPVRKLEPKPWSPQ